MADIPDPSLTDFVISTSTDQVAGAGMIQHLGTTANWIAQLLHGPFLYVLMGFAMIWLFAEILDAIPHQINGQKGYGKFVPPVAVFLLAAVLKSLSGSLRSA